MKYNTKFVDLKARKDLPADEKMNESVSLLLRSWTNLCTILFKGRNCSGYDVLLEYFTK